MVNIKMATKLVDGILFGIQECMCRIIYKIVYSNTWCCYDGREITHGASKKIGGGCYDDQGDGIKIRKWIDLDDEFDKLKSIIYSGEYKNGKKVGIWEILYFDDYKKNPQLFGGGSYDENGNGFKIGKWIDWIEFGKNYEGFITYHGNYKNGKKVGTWNVFNEFGLVDIIQYQN
ncbi:unnamed protein product [Paramecium sonneborni]|uniref:MORN repeat protein n=1 Tax=Paramecium sonneborni TaxID=65129 RepID=A0A8S1PKI2_9CILI|nr:unnamed protein product [Paramecium sonneborni]